MTGMPAPATLDIGTVAHACTPGHRRDATAGLNTNAPASDGPAGSPNERKGKT